MFFDFKWRCSVFLTLFSIPAVANAAEVDFRCLCRCSNATYGNLKVGILSTPNDPIGFIDFDYEYTDITEDSVCQAKNTQRCQGHDPSGRNLEIVLGTLSVCEMTATAGRKVGP